jgi:hypothetical protein
MKPKERVARQLQGQEVDRIPLMGGWFHGVDNLASFAGLPVDEYLRRPEESLLAANMALHVDCMIDPIVPTYREEIRTGEVLDASHAGAVAENLRRDAERIPDSESEVLDSFDRIWAEKHLREYFEHWTVAMGEMALIPTFWDSVPDFHLFDKYGYEAYFSAMALYPEAVGRLYWKSALEARARNEILAGQIRKAGLPAVVFTGLDICNSRGPMCSRAFLRAEYFPNEKIALKPLLDSGIRVIRQGFQYECGVDPYSIAARRSLRGERMLFFAGMNVTRTLPYGTTDDVRREIEFVLDFTEGGKGLFFFTSSSIGPEVPLENVTYAYNYVASGSYKTAAHGGKLAQWPGLAGSGGLVRV